MFKKYILCSTNAIISKILFEADAFLGKYALLNLTRGEKTWPAQ